MCYFILSYIDIVTTRAAARERVFHSWPAAREYPSSTYDSNNAYMAYERGRQAGRERGRQAGREGEGGKEAGKVRVREIARERGEREGDHASLDSYLPVNALDREAEDLGVGVVGDGGLGVEGAADGRHWLHLLHVPVNQESENQVSFCIFINMNITGAGGY